jgi:hypothetical protein
MSYQASVFNVMIASPSDVPAEREQIRAVIHEWNAIHSLARRVVLLPLGWETHSSPQMGAGPQTIINEQVLAKADLLVGVFWTRIGTQTEEFASGAVEEIERHINAGKPAMLYFSSSPIEADSVDHEQYMKLKEFKKSCQKRGLYEPYASVSAFREAFNRHLQLKLNDHPMFRDSEELGTAAQSIVETRHLHADLSREASTLLKEASTDKSGVIIHARYIGGTAIQTNGKNLIDSDEARIVAIWEGALTKLIELGLVSDRGHKGEVFQVTSEGYRVADTL